MVASKKEHKRNSQYCKNVIINRKTRRLWTNERWSFLASRILLLISWIKSIRILKKYNLIVIDYFTNEAIVREYDDVDLSKTSSFYQKETIIVLTKRNSMFFFV